MLATAVDVSRASITSVYHAHRTAKSGLDHSGEDLWLPTRARGAEHEAPLGVAQGLHFYVKGPFPQVGRQEVRLLHDCHSLAILAAFDRLLHLRVQRSEAKQVHVEDGKPASVLVNEGK